ncbi:MAG: cysteine desulfurase family protein [Vulcanimicrobiaceae bacterium]
MNERIYLDHAATTPVREEVLAEMLPWFASYNPSSLHAEGRRARAALDRARDEVAALLGASRKEIVFCGSGSEADNLAILGIAHSLRDRGRHVVTVATEHHAVLHAFDALREDGFDVGVVEVESDGSVDPERFARALRSDTIFASVMMANNETGAIAPIAQLAAIAREHTVAFHSDAVQAAAFEPIDVRELGVDALALSAHKFYGPKGVGLLWLRSGLQIQPMVVGGGQEFGLRSGTENVAGIVGFAAALRLAAAERGQNRERLGALRDVLEREILAAIPRAEAVVPPLRLPHISNISFGGVSGEALAMRLDLDGVAVSTGSACTSGAVEPSHVLTALGLSRERCLGSIRLSLGRSTSREQIVQAGRRIAAAVEGLRALGSNVA